MKEVENDDDGAIVVLNAPSLLASTKSLTRQQTGSPCVAGGDGAVVLSTKLHCLRVPNPKSFTRHWSALPDFAMCTKDVVVVLPDILDKPKLLGVPNPSHYSN